MARQDVRLDLPGIQVTPAAQPVDTYYRTNAPKTEEMVTNPALEAAQALAALSPTIRDFAAWQEKGAREHDEEAAQLTAQDLSDAQLKNMSTWDKEEWKQLGPRGHRPVYQLAVQFHANRRIAKEMVPDIVADYEAMKGEMLDPTKTPDIQQMVSELGTRWRDKFEGHYARQGAESILGPLLEKIDGEAHESRRKALRDSEGSNYSQAAYEAAVLVGSGLTKEDEAQVWEGVELEAGAMSGWSVSEIRSLKQDAFIRASMEMVKEDPIHGEERALELLDRLDDEFGDGGKGLFRPGTKDAEKLAAAYSDVRKLVREQDFESKGDVTELVTDLASKFKIENPEATEDQVIEWRDTVLKPRLLSMGLTEEQIQSELLAGEEFVMKRVDESDPQQLKELRIAVWTGAASQDDVIAAVNSGDVGWDDAVPLLRRLEETSSKNSSTSDALVRIRVGEVVQDVAKSLFGFSKGALSEEDQQVAGPLTDRFTTAFTQEMAAAGDDADAQSAVVARYSEGGEALENFRAEANGLGLAAKRTDIQLDSIFSKLSVTVGNLNRAFSSSFPEVVQGSPTIQLDLTAQFETELRDEADLVRLEKIAEGITNPEQIRAAVDLHLRNNAGSLFEAMKTKVADAANEATRALELQYGAQTSTKQSRPKFPEVDVETGSLPFAGVQAGRLDLGDLFDDSKERLKNPLSSPAGRQSADFERFTASTISLLDAFIDRRVSTRDEALESVGMSREKTGEFYHVGNNKYSPVTRWRGDGPTPAITNVSPESITIDGTTVDRDEAKKLLNTLYGLQGVPSEDLRNAKEPINIGVAGNTAVIPIWFKSGEHAGLDTEILELIEAKGDVPTDEDLANTGWGQIVKNLGLPQTYTLESGKTLLMATIVSKQQHALHHTSKGKQ